MGRLDLTAGELDRIDQAAASASLWADRVDVRFGPVDVEEILRVVDETQEVAGAALKLVVVDYLQLVASSRNLEDDVARLCTEMNTRAGARRFAVLLLSQVASDVIRRGRDHYRTTGEITGFCPGLGDTEWCRRAEKSVKAVWALFRPERWKREMGMETDDDKAELHVRKANFGPTGFVVLGWDGPRTRFYDL
jgi:replicative DNA helicase